MGSEKVMKIGRGGGRTERKESGKGGRGGWAGGEEGDGGVRGHVMKRKMNLISTQMVAITMRSGVNQE